MPLSERQFGAAHRLGQDVCVVAGPGSGKTSVLIERFSWLVTKRRISPRRILAITFTEKAATEIRERMVKAFEREPGMRGEIERAWVSTIHSFCARLLRENAIEARIDPAFAVLEQAIPALRKAADEALEGMFAEDPDRMRRFLRSLAVATERDGFVPDLASSLIEIYEAIRLAGASFDSLRQEPAGRLGRTARLHEIAQEIQAEDPNIRTENQARQHAEVLRWAEAAISLSCNHVSEEHLRIACKGNWNKNALVKGSRTRHHEDELRGLCRDLLSDYLIEYYAAERQTILEALERIDSVYRSSKQARSMLDFDDLEEAAIRLLESNAELREQVRAQFDYVLMDELQDTNPLQWRLLELLRRPSAFFAVGDVNQSIYGFRHADPALFGNYRLSLEDAGFEIDELRDNYRTRPELLQVINRLFEGAPGIEPHTLTAGRVFPPKDFESAEVMAVFGENSAEAERLEAMWVSQRIVELVGHLQVRGRPAEYGDIAILTRANYSTAELQWALDRAAVPSVVLGGMTFYDTREVRDLGLLLEVLANPCNEVALAGLLRSPLFGLCDEDLLKLARHGSLLRGVEAESPQAWQRISELRRIRNTTGPDRLLRRVMDECDYESGLSERARANVSKFLAMLRDRHARNPQTISQLAADIRQAAPEAEAPPAEFGNVVRLMTMHKAKGLEFPVVFLPFLHKGRSYGFPVISYSHQGGLGVKWRNPVDSDGVGDAFWRANREAAQGAQDAEENRLLYVGCTRAQEHLVTSWSVTGNERPAWSGLVARQLCIDLSVATNEVSRQDGIRVFTTDRKPPVTIGHSSRNASPLLHILDSPAMTDEADSVASVTDISRFVECPRKYYLAGYLKQKKRSRTMLRRLLEEDFPADAGKWSASEIGVQVHALLAGQPLQHAAEEAILLADSFRSSDLYRRLSRATRKEHEWDFLMDLGGIVLRGQIDLWFEHNGELIVVDYKTDRDPDSLAISGHSLQLQIYALALERQLRRVPDRAVLFFLRESRQHEVDLSPLALGAAFEACHNFRAAQTSVTFPVSPGTHCRRCDFVGGLCPVGLNVPDVAGSPVAVKSLRN